MKTIAPVALCAAFLLSAPASAQNVLFPANQGDMIVKGATTWGPVPGGTAGCVLQSQGPTAAPTWQCSLPLNFQLPPMAVNTLWCNVSGAQAPAVACNISQILNTIDYDIQRPPLAGSIPYVGTDNTWHLSPPSTAGFVWTTQGPGTIPRWAAVGVPVGFLDAGSTTILNGTSNGILFNNAGVLGNTASTNNAVLVTNGSGVPSLSTILPTAVQTNITRLGTLGTINGSGKLLWGANAANASPDFLLTLSLASSTLPVHDPAVNVDEWWALHLAMPDPILGVPQNGGMGIDTFGNGFGVYDCRVSGGTSAAPTQVPGDTLLCVLGALAKKDTAGFTGGLAQFRLYTDGTAPTTASQPGRAEIWTTPSGASAFGGARRTAAFRASGVTELLNLTIIDAVGSGGSVAAVARNSNSAGLGAVQAENNTSSFLTVQMLGTTIGGTQFGVTRNNMARLGSFGAANLAIGTLDAAPLILGTNTAAVLTLSVAGGASIGTSSDPGAGMLYTNAATFMIRTKTSYSNGAAAGAGTIANAPAAGNPTKWIPVDDNGTTRYVPAW